jgi:cytochrome c oxidase cbb3-type subunit I
MWRTYNAAGTLNYSFLDSIEAMRPYYIVRFIGGALFWAGMITGAFNIWMTVRGVASTATDRPLTQAAE